MVDELPDSIDSQAEYSDWIALLADQVIEILNASVENTTEISQSRIEDAVEEEIASKMRQLEGEQIPWDILKYSNYFDPPYVQSRLRDSEDNESEVAKLASDALKNNLVETVMLELKR